MFGLGTVVWLLVTVLLFATILRRRKERMITPDSRGGDIGRNWPILGGILLPFVVIGIVFGYSIFTLAAVDLPNTQHALKIEIVGRRWWWEVKYPDLGVTTANEIHIPVGKPVKIEIKSQDVIHSFWVPQLQGKMDAIPTRINTVTLQADKAGVYRGECAEYCGLQHAHMGFMVVAQSEADYNAWVNTQQQPAVIPVTAGAQQGQQVFMNAGCIFCHTVRGLDDKAIDRSGIDLGPDLTHLSSRMTIAGATLTTNKGNLAGWIVDTQHRKPGNLMPTIYIDSNDLQNLLAYLEGLK
jgi:cytochrome c oxidase subunit 2